MTVTNPKKIPGTLEIMIGQSLYVLIQPYPAQREALIIATKGCKKPTGWPKKLLSSFNPVHICGL